MDKPTHQIMEKHGRQAADKGALDLFIPVLVKAATGGPNK